MLGCCRVLSSQKSATILGMTAPLLALTIPLLDTSLAIVRRFLRRQPIFTADRGYIHHRLPDRGFTPRRTALLLYGVAAIGAIFSLAMADNHLEIPVIVVFGVVTWIGIQRLGFTEFDTMGQLLIRGSFVVRLFNTYGPGEFYSPYRSVNCRFLYCGLNGLPSVSEN
jgi:UDP-GlcNAc:undecaprenyl-phosphate GlcNAc-1-phosphate transferase